jgi:membrane fusion protein, heavy metal efflux system
MVNFALAAVFSKRVLSRPRDAPLMKVGLSLEVQVLAYPARVFKGTVSYVAPSIDPNTHRLSVRADVENPDGALKPGMFASFSIITGEAATAPAVPLEAVIYEGEKARVWLTGEGDTLELRDIRTVRTSDGMAEVRAGLSPGDRVVTSGTVFIDRAARTD